MDNHHNIYAFPLMATHTSRRIRQKRHCLVIAALILDAFVLALAWIVQKQDIFLDTNARAKTLQKFLPVIGALVGFCVTSMNVLAFTALFTEYARIRMVGDGLTLSELGHLHSLGICPLLLCHLDA